MKNKTMKVEEIERRQCGKCSLVGDWKRFADGRLQGKCPRCGSAGYSSQKIS